MLLFGKRRGLSPSKQAMMLYCIVYDLRFPTNTTTLFACGDQQIHAWHIQPLSVAIARREAIQ
jgi:hypothetical protein